MEPTGLERIRSLAARFRAAIERCDRQTLPVGFEQFPRGSCGDAALLLGTYLAAQGLGGFEYVSGSRGRRDIDPPTWQSHAWLRQGMVIVDITADQFAEVAEAVLVTTTSSWHETFSQQVQHAADYCLFDDGTRTTLGAAYRLICSHCENGEPPQ